MIYNDLSLNYQLYRSDSADQFITAIVPTFEAHINTPLTHRAEYNLFDPSGTPDVVNLTYGLHSEFFGRAVATFGFVTPVTGPRPFEFEVVGMLNIYLGGRNVRAAGRAPTGMGRFPVVGG